MMSHTTAATYNNNGIFWVCCVVTREKKQGRAGLARIDLTLIKLMCDSLYSGLVSSTCVAFV